VPLKHLWNDVSHHRVPNLSFVVPNLCHDMHDCSVATGNSWLHWFMGRVRPLSAFTRTGVIVVTFDEDDGTRTNHIATIVVNPRAKRGRRLTAAFTHYSLVRAVDAAFGLPALGNAQAARSLPLGPLP
jgi:acid phosphatase